MALSPTSSRGGGGTSSGTPLPAADPAGVTTDTTTYDNTITGTGKLTTLVFPQDTAAVAFAIEGDAYPRFLIGTDLNDAGISLSDGTFDPYEGGAMVYLTGGGSLGLYGYTPVVPPLGSVLASSDNAGAQGITNLAEPTNAQDAATKNYVDTSTPTIANGSVTTLKIADTNVTTGKIADNAITGAKIADNAVTNAALTDNAVATAELNDNAVTTAKIAIGAVDSSVIAPGGVTTAVIADAAVTADKLAVPTGLPAIGVVWNDGGVLKTRLS